MIKAMTGSHYATLPLRGAGGATAEQIEDLVDIILAKVNLLILSFIRLPLASLPPQMPLA